MSGVENWPHRAVRIDYLKYDIILFSEGKSMVVYDIKKESHVFGLMIMDCYSYLIKTTKEFSIARQLLRSGTSIGANIREAQDGESKKDFLHKMNISLKEAKETQYRLWLLHDSWWIAEYIGAKELKKKANELSRMLTKIVRTTKQNLWINR